VVGWLAHRHAPGNASERLAVDGDGGQTFDEYVATVTRPSASERVIYLQPFDQVPMLSDHCLSSLAEFTGAFFGLDVRVLSSLALDPATLTSRLARDTGRPQVFAPDLLLQLLAVKPADAFCLIGITASDLFPTQIVNFAFGEASASCRVGVCSVARYGPPFCVDTPDEHQGAMRRRCCRVIAHEIGHIAGIEHCVYFRCLMNGSASLVESDRRPLHLCPIDLGKLRWLLGFDLEQRYRRLQRFWLDAGDHQEAGWMAGQLEAPLGWRGRLATLMGRG